MAEKKEFVPPELADYIPAVVKRLMRRIDSEPSAKVALYGFSDNMKWLYRLLKESGRDPILCDWRPKYIAYDCGGKNLVSVDSLRDDGTLLVVCVEEIHDMKASMRYLIDKQFNRMPVIYDRSEPHDPFHQEEPFRGIAQRARARARSMISDGQLFDLIQFIRATANVPGDVVEYGSLHGGSGAILVEAVNHYGKKLVWLFDSFAGIPKSKYGLDHRWDGSFSNNSYHEVRDAFSDCDNVRVVKGNITETFDSVKNPISFGYVASDTLESGELLLNFMWPKLSPGGIIAVCDYGSYPNCVPLTVMTDKFLEDKPNAFVFHTAHVGIFFMKCVHS
ncbi:MAG TPA: TylF/MycF/NovP-related O-methyltransferase [Gemmatimonadaceae bacterium]|jgi:O-methyltransferase